MMKILLAEDTRDLNRVLTAALEHSGYAVDSAFDGEEATGLIRQNGYDIIVLDIMMPKKDGIQVLKDLRADGIVTPVLMLTAKAEVDDRVAGLDAGADDYLTKPFAMKELLARVNAMSRRRAQYDAEPGILQFGDIRLNSSTLELSCENAVRLSNKEFELLSLFVQNKSRGMDSEYLLEQVWQDTPEAKESTVWLYIMYLRGKLSAISSRVTIEGERGSTYRIACEE